MNGNAAAIILVLCFFCFKAGKAQNLVPNNSFEVLDSCPTNWTPNDCYAEFAVQWKCLANSTSDIYLACDGTVPNPPLGYPPAQEGGNYVGIYSYAKYMPNTREYLSIKLLDTLIAYHAYKVGYYVYLSPTKGDFFEVRNMGAVLADTFIYNGPDFGVLPYSPQIINNGNNLLNSTNTWTMVCDTFFAEGNERYIAVGNFFNDSNTQAIVSGASSGFPDSSAYYFIDNVFVEEIPGMVGFGKKENINRNIEVQPNPNNGNFTIEYSKLPKDCCLEIYELSGKFVYNQVLLNTSSSIIMHLEELGSGLYIYKIKSTEGLLKTGKLVISK